jgi:hypothetical protein
MRPRGRGLVNWLRAGRKAGWPEVTGGLAFLAGLLMLAASALIAWQVGQPGSTADAPASRPRSTPLPAAQPGARDDSLLDAPRYSTHLDDVALIFALAAQRGIALGQVDYRTDAQSSLPVMLRIMDLRLAEDYPAFKPFVADLLARLPHLFLQEIRIDRGNSENTKAQVTLKLVLVYRRKGQGFQWRGPWPATSPLTGHPQP